MSPVTITEQELNSIKGLLHWLNAVRPEEAHVQVVVDVFDSNGDKLGTIKRNVDSGKSYGMELGVIL